MARKPQIIDGVVYVPLTRGFVAKLDVCDIELASDPWIACASRSDEPPYARRRGWPDRSWIHLHREVMKRAGHEIDGFDVDHINRDRLDCQRTNLRRTRRSGNCQNTGKKPSQLYKGIFYRQKSGRWIAQIRAGDKKRMHLGCFLSPEAAAKAYDEAAKKYFGEFACTNGLV